MGQDGTSYSMLREIPKGTINPQGPYLFLKDFPSNVVPVVSLNLFSLEGGEFGRGVEMPRAFWAPQLLRKAGAMWLDLEYSGECFSESTAGQPRRFLRPSVWGQAIKQQGVRRGRT